METYYNHYSTIGIPEDTEDNLGIIADSAGLANTYKTFIQSLSSHFKKLMQVSPFNLYQKGKLISELVAMEVVKRKK